MGGEGGGGFPQQWEPHSTVNGKQSQPNHKHIHIHILTCHVSLGLEVLGQLLLVSHGNPVGSAITTIARMPQPETRAPEQDGLPNSRRQAFFNLVSTQLWHEFLNVPTNRGEEQPPGGPRSCGSTTEGWKHNPVDHFSDKKAASRCPFSGIFSVFNCPSHAASFAHVCTPPTRLHRKTLFRCT